MGISSRLTLILFLIFSQLDLDALPANLHPFATFLWFFAFSPFLVLSLSSLVLLSSIFFFFLWCFSRFFSPRFPCFTGMSSQMRCFRCRVFVLRRRLYVTSDSSFHFLNIFFFFPFLCGVRSPLMAMRGSFSLNTFCTVGGGFLSWFFPRQRVASLFLTHR